MSEHPHSTQASSADSAAADSPARVLLIHGIWNAKVWMWPFARLLRRQGFSPELFGYVSVFGPPERAAEQLIARLRRDPIPHLVGHSLGGLVALEALRRAPDLPVQRVVCLGSPLLGSAAACALAARPGLRWALGRSEALLQRGCPPWQGSAELGVIAGDRPYGLGGVFADLDGPSDGTVWVAETRLPGVADHCVIDESHSSLVLSPAVARQAAYFLRYGRFANGV
jgi:pimeloyl-ACP methyl ester carboxylesterase